MLSKKVCIVAGGGRGIGEAVAIELGRQGATVVVNDIGSDVHGKGKSEEPAEKTVAEIEKAGGNGMAHIGDIASLDYTESLVEDTIEEYGRLDGAVNFAGILRDSISYRMDSDEWDQVIRVHLRGHFALLRNVAAHWRSEVDDREFKHQRSFLGVSSRSALGSPGQLNYSSAKAGVLGMMRTAARELAQYNIRVNALMPTAYTRMIEDIPEDKRPFTQEEMPAQRVGAMVVYLMSDEADGITGSTLRVAGDSVGIVSDPEISRLGFKKGGWEPEEIAEEFQSKIAEDTELGKSDTAF
jgi:NAD(P)-dependent dehydrogenase (short-subunit alcohol dehydrogenase family)